MCGIFGVVASQDAPYSRGQISRSLGILAKESQSRGKDSSGLVFFERRTAAYNVYKGAVKLSDLFRFAAVKGQLERSLRDYAVAGARSPFVVIGHSRLVTNGSQLNDENNQPITKDGMIGVHNGIIVNDDSLWEANPDLQREYSIDTEVLLALVRRHIDAGHDLPAALARAQSEIEGTVSTALLIPERSALALHTNNGSLYTLTNAKDVLFFASEYYPLSALAKQMGIDLTNSFELRHMASGNGAIVDIGRFDFNRFADRDHLTDTPVRPAESAPLPDFAITVNAVGGSGAQRELVSDVAQLARAPEAARLGALLQHNHERVARLRRCIKCLLPDTFPFIAYDDQGVCNYCRNYKLRNQPKPMDDLLELLEPYRKPGGQPDCIVPFSGGRDSTFALHTIKTRLDFNPIAYTYDWGMVTDLGRRNIARVCGKLGVENIIVAADIHFKRNNIRKNINAWLRRPHLGMVPLFMAGDKYFYYYVDRVKRQTGTNLNIWGVNPMENTDFKVGFLGVAPDHDKKYIYSLSVRRQLDLFKGAAKAILSNPWYLNSSVPDTIGSFISRSVIPHRDYFHLYDYLLWDEQEIDDLLLGEYNWERAVDTSTTWRIGDGTAAFYNYIYYTVAGFSEHDTFRSNQIREGMISREEGLRLVNEENHPRYPTLKWYFDIVNIDFEQAIRVVNDIPKLYA